MQSQTKVKITPTGDKLHYLDEDGEARCGTIERENYHTKYWSHTGELKPAYIEFEEAEVVTEIEAIDRGYGKCKQCRQQDGGTMEDIKRDISEITGLDFTNKPQLAKSDLELLRDWIASESS